MGDFQDFRKVVESTSVSNKLIRGQKDRLVVIKANADNSGKVFISTRQETGLGYPLNAGEGLGDIVLAPNQEVFFSGDTVGDKLEGITYDNPYFKQKGDND